MIDKDDYAEQADEYERAPEGFEADFNLSDTQVPDYPVVVEVDGFGEASAHLASWDLAEEMQGDEDYVMSASGVARIIREHYVSPSFDGLNADGVRQMKLVAPDSLLGAIMPGMDAQMQTDGSARIDTKN